MNRAWMALAGLALVGAAALWHQSPNRPPLLVADSASPGECRAWRDRALAQERQRKGWFAIFEGFSTLQGLCHPQDIARGRELIEGAIATGLDPTLAIDYMMALRKLGETHAAEEWAMLSAFVYLHTIVRRGVFPVRDATTEAVVAPVYRAFAGTRSWEKDLADLEQLLSRPAKVPAVEKRPIHMLLSRVERGDPTLGHYLRYLALRDGRVAKIDGTPENLDLREAARCGHPAAIRRLGEMVLSGEIEERWLNLYTIRVAWLHHRRTRQEGDLLVALLTKGGSRSWLSADPEFVARFDQQIADRCAPQRPLGSRLFPGD